MGTCHVLVVDDQDIVRILMARIPRDGGYDVLEANNGATALELLGEREPSYFDLIVTDSMLVGMDGYTFALRVRSKPPCDAHVARGQGIRAARMSSGFSY